MSGAIQVRWSSGQDVCQNRSPALARSLLYGSSNGMVSQALDLGHAEEVAQPLVVAPGLPAVVRLGPVKVTEAPAERRGERVDRLVTAAELGLAAGDQPARAGREMRPGRPPPPGPARVRPARG